MQKATYYDNSGLFGGYTYPKPDSYNYGPAHQSYPTSNIESDYQGSVCPIQTSTVRPPTLKDSDLNGDCMRQSSSQSSSNNNSSSSQATSIGEQQAPPLSASSPSSNSSASQKKKSPSSSASNSSTPALTKQIFPWMKETRQNAKQKSNNCNPTAGRDHDGDVCVCVCECEWGVGGCGLGLVVSLWLHW